jgi:hypothetical protein
MPREMKASTKYQHVYAIIRYETDADSNAPIDLRITVKKVVVDPHYAEEEVKRLNDLNQDKGSYYFYQVTRFEDVPVEAQTLPPRAERTRTAMP